MRCVRSIAVIAFILGIASDSQTAVVIKELEFNVDGVLPSSEPDIEFFNNTSMSEASLYSVSGGFLRQRTLPGGTEVVGSAGYTFPNQAVTGGGLSSALSTVMEAQLTVLDVTSSEVQQSGVFFAAYDGADRYLAFITPTGVSLATSSSGDFVSVPFDVFGLHTYRFESPANSSEAHFFIDGVYRASWTAFGTTNNGFNFGDGISPAGNAANVDWNFVHVYQDAAMSGIPEPTSLLVWSLICAAGLAVAWLRRQ